ncbi:MAG: DUF554 domain-containing protein [Phototrophicales bacterium]|nr:DUF554 domain-containing protein [Phototrophicales bacterium]
MAGTLLNMATVAFGSLLGLLIGNRLPKRIQESVMTGLGLLVFYLGMDNAGKTGNLMIVLLAILIGVIIGELLRIDRGLENLAGWLQSRFAGKLADGEEDTEATLVERERFINGFVTTSLVYCIGPLTIIGSIQDGMGLAEGFRLIAIKSALDGFGAIAFATTFGVGASFSVLTILVVQGGLSLLGMMAGSFMTDPMINELTATGGIVLMGLALSLMEIKKIRLANFLPALVIAPLLVLLGGIIGIDIYPF